MRPARSFLLIVAAAAIVLPVAGEITVRSIPTLLPVNGQIRMQAIMMKDKVLPDQEIGFVRAPRLHQEVKTMDFSYVRETDSFGFPNRDPWPAKADIVILGDSLVMGEGTGLDRSFVGRFQSANPSLQVVNLGIAGAGPDRQLLAYRKYGMKLSPSVVLAFFYCAADITNSEHFERWRREAPETEYNRFRLGLGRRKDHSLLDRLRLAGVIGSQFQGNQQNSQVFESADGSRIFLEESTVDYLRQGLKPEQVERMIRAVTELRDLVQSQGGKAYVVLIPSKEEAFARAFKVVDAARRALRASETEYLDLYPLIEQAARSRSPYFTRDIHLNEYGNQVVADYLNEWWRRRTSAVGHSELTLTTAPGGRELQ